MKKELDIRKLAKSEGCREMAVELKSIFKNCLKFKIKKIDVLPEI